MLSTTRVACCRWLSSASAAMSAMLSSGLVGVSTQTTVVFGRIAACTAARSCIATGVYSKPHRLSTRATSRNVPP